MNWLFQAAKTGRIKSLAQAIREFFNMNGRMPSVRERNTMGSILQDITQKSNVIEFPKDRITNPFKPRPGDVKKTDKSPLSTLLSKQSKELEGIDTKQGMGFYREMGDMMKKHELEELELKYDEMFNKILEKAKRIESDPLPLLEAELGKKLTGKETPTQLLEIFKNRPKKASGGIARVGYRFGSRGPGAQVQEDKRIKELMEERFKSLMDKSIKSTPEGVLTEQIYPDSDAMTLDRPSKPEIITEAYDPYAPDSPTAMTIHPKAVEYDDGTIYFKDTGEYYNAEGVQVEGPSEGAKPIPETLEAAEGGIARVGMMIGGFTKAQVLIQMMKNTLKGSKDTYIKKTFPNMIKELTKNPELAKDPKVWNFFTNKLPKNQRLVVHSDDSVDFWKQSDFGPHNIETMNKFMKKHNLSRDEAVRIQNMQPEDQILEMKRLETIRNRTKNASGGIAGELHLNEGGRVSFVKGGKVSSGLAHILGV